MKKLKNESEYPPKSRSNINALYQLFSENVMFVGMLERSVITDSEKTRYHFYDERNFSNAVWNLK